MKTTSNVFTTLIPKAMMYLQRIVQCTRTSWCVLLLWSILQWLAPHTGSAQIQILRQESVVSTLDGMDNIVQGERLARIALRNTTSNPVQIRVIGDLSVNNTPILQSIPDRMPLITVQPGETRILLAQDIFLRGAIAGATLNSAPVFPINDIYQVCFRITDANGNILVPRSCINGVVPPRIDIAQARSQIRRILGFEAVIGSIRLQGNGDFLVSGRVIIPSNNVFTVADGRSLNFVNAIISAEQLLAGATDVDPVGGSLQTVETELQMMYNGWVPVTQRDATGLTIQRDPTLTGRPGVIREPLFINMNALLAQAPNSGVTGDVRLQLAEGEALSANGSSDVPAIISSGRLSITQPLTLINADSVTWRIRGFTIGQLQSPVISVTQDSLRFTAQYPITVDSLDITALTLNFIFSRTGGYDDRITSPPLSIGDRISIRLNDGDVSNSGFTFSGVMTLSADGFTAPVQFNIATLAFTRNNNKWVIGTSTFRYQRAAAGRISLFANNDADFTFKQDADGVFSVTGRGTFGLGLPRGFQLGLPVSMKFDSDGGVEAVMTQRIIFGIPTKASRAAAQQSGDQGDRESLVRVEVNSITYASPNQSVIMDGSITFSLPRGIEFEAGNFGFDQSGLVSGYAKILMQFRKGIRGGGGIIYERGEDKVFWGGSFDVEVERGTGTFGFGAEFKYAARNDWNLLLKFTKVPGYVLSAAPPVWLEEIRGSIATSNGQWQFGLGGLFTVLSPGDDIFKPGFNINADGVFRIGGTGPTELELNATVDVRGFGIGTRLGVGQLLLNFTDMRFTGFVNAGFNFLGVASATGNVNFDINMPANQFYIAGNVAYNILNAAQANGSFWLAKDYTVSGGGINFVRSGFHADFTQTLINWRSGINLGIASFNAYANAGYFWEIDINGNGIGGRLQSNISAGGEASIFGIGLSGFTSFNLDGRFGYWNNNFTLDASTQGRVEVRAGSSQCNPGCNDYDGCTWRWGAGAAARICVGIGARVQYNRGFSIDVGRR
jgi:hypothetical protein